MASTIAIYTGNGSTTDFTVPFDYLAKKFVRVSLGLRILQGGDYGDTSKDYYFLDKTTVRLKTPPAVGEELTVRRYTSATDRIVSFKDASILKATDLDTSSIQTIHIAEEARDVINDALIVDKDGNWDAKGNRIINVGDPVADGDAVNFKTYKQDAMGAYQSRIEAEKARDAASLSEVNAKNSEVASGISENNAKNSEVIAKASAGTAVSASKHADAVRVENEAIITEARVLHADIKASDANVSQNTQLTITKANEAKASADAAKQSELNAKASEDKVVQIGGTIVPIAPEIKIVANNINHVVTDSQNIAQINVVSSDLEGTLQDSLYEDYGDLGNPSAPMPSITGGNIKVVADNIADVRTVAGLAPDFKVAIGAVKTVTDLTTRAEKASADATQSANNARSAEASAMAAEMVATDNANLAKDWANKTTGTVDGIEYSAKYYAQKAKTEGGTAVESAKSQALNAILTEKNSTLKAITDEGAKQKALLDTQVAEATRQANLAANSATLASNEADAAQAAERASTASAVASEASAKNSANSASTASAQATLASNKALEAKNSADTAALHKDAAQVAERNAQQAAQQVSNKLDVSVFNGFVDYGDLGNP